MVEPMEATQCHKEQTLFIRVDDYAAALNPEQQASDAGTHKNGTISCTSIQLELSKMCAVFLFKNKAETLPSAVKNIMQATHGRVRGILTGDLILIAQTKSSLGPHKKPIRWIMDFVSCEEDVSNESDRIWSHHWNYIIRGTNIRSVEPFDIDEIKESSRNYAIMQKPCKLYPRDEEIVLSWISQSSIINKIGSEDDGEIEDSLLSLNNVISALDEKYAGKPEFKSRVVRLIQRPSTLSEAIKLKHDHICQLCGVGGFKKRGGGRYAETHHMVELNHQAPLTLQSWNVLVVCPTCHKKLHFAEVESEFLNPGWKMVLGGKKYILR